MTDTTKSPQRTWLYVALVFIVFWIAYLSFFAPRNRRPLEGSGIDQPAEYNWALEDLEGQQVSFARFQGKAVFLNIWATWCGPCVREMPSIARLAARDTFKDKNIAFVCVSVDDASETVRQFVRDKNWPMTVLRANKSTLPPVFQTEGIPATFVISPAGRIVAAEVGSSDWDQSDVVAFLEKTAAMPASPAADISEKAAPAGR
jgi:thiol-disulfide isomerase/thioredoxin